jgi:hypothetical protein
LALLITEKPGEASETTEFSSEMIVQTEKELIEKFLRLIEGQAVELLSVDILLDAIEQEGVAPRNNLAFDYPIEYLTSLTFS